MAKTHAHKSSGKTNRNEKAEVINQLKKKKKKKKRQSESIEEEPSGVSLEKVESLESRENAPVTGRHYTVSIAVPCSVVDNAQTLELKTSLIGQIARSAVIFCIDEIVVFDDNVRQNHRNNIDPQDFMCRLLEYLECPQYLRKVLYPFHHYFSRAGIIHPLNCPSHLPKDEESEYREGVVLDMTINSGSLVNIGVEKDARIDKILQPGLRVTVKLDLTIKDEKYLNGKVVSHNAPREERGRYWSYTVREATNLLKAIQDCPYDGGYDLTIGTSDKGTSIDEIDLPKFRHLLIVFGGLDGLEACEETNGDKIITDPQKFFNYYLNTCPKQGSRTIRTEEAVLITLAALRPKIKLVANQL